MRTLLAQAGIVGEVPEVRAMSDGQEMTLQEWCDQLPKSHLVHRELKSLRARVVELETRLEITPDHPCDGIACRDQTIDALENRCVYLDAGLAEKEREIEATERNISSAMDTIHKQDWQIAQLERAFAIAKYHCRPDHRDFVELQRIATALDQERGK